MSKVYLYSRVSTDAQTLAQQERTAYEWLNSHNMQVTEVVSDEGVSGGVSFKDRNLGKVLLPKMEAGDMLIVSEVSRLGRSMFDLSKLIHTELKPRKIRLVCVSMGIDLRCDKLTAIDELILNNFSFAAQLEKQLISERTLSALQVRKQQGVKLGGASDKWQENYKNKSSDEISKVACKRGKSRRERHHTNRDMVVFKKVLMKVFPEYADSENPAKWMWCKINCKQPYRTQILDIMRDYADMDEGGALFKGWDFADIESNNDTAQRLRNYMFSFKRSYKKQTLLFNI